MSTGGMPSSLALFKLLERDFNRKIDVEIKSIDAQVKASEFEVNRKNLDIKSLEIDQTRNREESRASANKLKLSEARYEGLSQEMKSVRQRVDGLEAQQKEVLKAQPEGATAISLLLYSSEVQQNLRYYDELDGEVEHGEDGPGRLQAGHEVGGTADRAIGHPDRKVEE